MYNDEDLLLSRLLSLLAQQLPVCLSNCLISSSPRVKRHFSHLFYPYKSISTLKLSWGFEFTQGERKVFIAAAAAAAALQ